jgi:Flp pilus assembly protein TadG
MRPEFIHRNEGASSAEFALVVLPFISLIMAGLGLGFMLWANTTLHYAAEDAARCAVVKKSVCTDANSIVSYAQRRYRGPSIAPQFTPSQFGCGAGSWTVTASANYPLNTGLVNLTIPLSTSACFPG